MKTTIARYAGGPKRGELVTLLGEPREVIVPILPRPSLALGIDQPLEASVGYERHVYRRDPVAGAATVRYSYVGRS